MPLSNVKLTTVKFVDTTFVPTSNIKGCREYILLCLIHMDKI